MASPPASVPCQWRIRDGHGCRDTPAPRARLFELVDRDRLAAAFAAGPALPASLLDVSDWLTRYQVRLV